MAVVHKWWSRIKKRRITESKPCPPVQEDNITLELPLLRINLSRKLNIDVPHEVSIIIPRAEIRFSGETTELIYSSITVVHAPRHPLAGELPPAGGGTDLPGPPSVPSEHLSNPGESHSQEPAVKVTFQRGANDPQHTVT
ncbi:MAG: hypothetical protein ACOY46_19480 [Bacillota bacterium]